MNVPTAIPPESDHAPWQRFLNEHAEQLLQEKKNGMLAALGPALGAFTVEDGSHCIVFANKEAAETFKGALEPCGFPSDCYATQKGTPYVSFRSHVAELGEGSRLEAPMDIIQQALEARGKIVNHYLDYAPMRDQVALNRNGSKADWFKRSLHPENHDRSPSVPGTDLLFFNEAGYPLALSFNDAVDQFRGENISRTGPLQTSYRLNEIIPPLQKAAHQALGVVNYKGPDGFSYFLVFPDEATAAEFSKAKTALDGGDTTILPNHRVRIGNGTLPFSQGPRKENWMCTRAAHVLGEMVRQGALAEGQTDDLNKIASVRLDKHTPGTLALPGGKSEKVLKTPLAAAL